MRSSVINCQKNHLKHALILFHVLIINEASNLQYFPCLRYPFCTFFCSYKLETASRSLFHHLMLTISFCSSWLFETRIAESCKIWRLWPSDWHFLLASFIMVKQTTNRRLISVWLSDHLVVLNKMRPAQSHEKETTGSSPKNVWPPVPGADFFKSQFKTTRQ